MTITYQSETSQLDEGRVLKFGLRRDGRPLSWATVVERWQRDQQFREFFVSILANAPFQAYFWETPPLTDATLGDDFEFVLVNSHQLSGISPNRQAFSSHFEAAPPGASVISFENLGGDATLIAPCPQAPLSACSQLANFTREASRDQQHQLWKLVGATLEKRVGQKPVWLNTSGLGVYWLHIRLDCTPKYYTHDPYRNWKPG